MSKYIEQNNLKNIIEFERKTFPQKKIILAQGSFDVITFLDIRYLRDTKKVGDILVVALYSDNLIKQKFGEKRPITPFEDRLEILKQMEMIDYIFRIDNFNISGILNSSKPDFIFDERFFGYDVVQAVLAKYKKQNL